MVREEYNPVRVTSDEIVLTRAGTIRGMQRLLPIALIVLPYGAAFGAAGIEQGLSASQVVFMSVLVFSGAAQYASLDFLTDPIAFGSLAIVVLVLKARLVVMGAALSPWINRLPVSKRILAVTFLSDPNFADSQPALKNGERDLGVLLGGGLILWASWCAGTTVGALAGAVVGNPRDIGIDVMMVCFFAATLAGHPDRKALLGPMVLASAVAVITLNWLPVGWNVVLAAAVGGSVGMFRHDN